MPAYEQFADSPRDPQTKTRSVINIDCSPSQNTNDIGMRRCEAAIIAARRLGGIKAQKFPHDEVAIISFAATAACLRPLKPVTPDLRDVDAALKRYQLRPATNMTSGLLLSEHLLDHRSATPEPQPVGALKGMLRRFLFETEPDSSRPNQTASPGKGSDAIVLLTDGCHNTGPDPEPVAKRLKAKGVWIATIGVGSDTEFDEAILKRMASKDADGRPCYRHILDAGDLIRQFEQFAYSIRPMREEA